MFGPSPDLTIREEEVIYLLVLVAHYRLNMYPYAAGVIDGIFLALISPAYAYLVQ